MKGLILTHMGKREEGLELVKKGMRLDLTSHICWHVFGLIQKGEKNYEEALKSYTQALRFDKVTRVIVPECNLTLHQDNLNILRDTAQLQTQLRLFDGLVETRYALLRLRPNLRQNWLALAVAYHLSGNLVQTKNILEHYEKVLRVSASSFSCNLFFIFQNRTYLITTLSNQKPRSTMFACWKNSVN